MSYRFAAFDLDPVRRVLEHDGRPIVLTAKAFDLLLALVERRDRVVTKDELMAIVWPDTTVEEQNLTVTMSILRKALGDQPAEHRFIVTFPGRGYRFVADVTGDRREGHGRARPQSTGNLPGSLSSFVGRETELADVAQLLASHRLITLTGSGGCGKTRLAIESARRFESQALDGVWLVELAPLADPELVAQQAATAFGLRGDAGRSAIDVLVDALHKKTALLILDNCEHLIDASARLSASLLERTPGLRVLATSREPLNVAGEHVWRVPSLAGSDAVRLFAERAAAVLPAFTPTEATADAIGRICERLDGIPLAIELTAARMGVLSVDQIAERLDDRFGLLTGGARTARPRHRTLRASIDWSYDLLSGEEQALFRRLSVFVGGWTLEAAEMIAARNADEAASVFDLLAALVNKSLVTAEAGPDGRVRYRMLETIRQYARERLADSGEEEWVRRKHLEFFRTVAARAEVEVVGPDAARWLQQVSAEHDNLRAAFDWTLGRDPESSLRLVGSLYICWIAFGYLREASQRIDMALHAGGTIFFYLGDVDRMADRAREALPLARQADAPIIVTFSLVYLACRCQYLEGDVERAAPMFEEALALARRVGAPLPLGLTLIHLGGAALFRNRLEQAAAWLDEGLEVARSSRNPMLIGVAVVNAGRLAIAQGDLAGARAHCLESLRLRVSIGDRIGTIESFETLAEVTALQGEADQAARLLGVAAGLGQATGAGVLFLMRAAHDRTEGRIRADLGDARFTEAWSEGVAMTIERAMALVESANP